MSSQLTDSKKQSKRSDSKVQQFQTTNTTPAPTSQKLPRDASIDYDIVGGADKIDFDVIGGADKIDYDVLGGADKIDYDVVGYQR